MKDIFLEKNIFINPFLNGALKNDITRRETGGVTQIGDKMWQRGGVRPKKVILSHTQKYLEFSNYLNGQGDN